MTQSIFGLPIQATSSFLLSRDGASTKEGEPANNLVGILPSHPLIDLINEIDSGNSFVNIHTAQKPTREIREQI